MRRTFTGLLSLIPRTLVPRGRGASVLAERTEARESVVLYARVGITAEVVPTGSAGEAQPVDRVPTSVGRVPSTADRVPSRADRVPSRADRVSTRGALEMRPTLSHRERLLSMRLSHLKLLGPSSRERLEAVGIVTAGDLLMCDPAETAERLGASERAARNLARHRRGIRFAAAVPGLMPRDAMLLIRVHRRSTRGLASESATVLHRDLERFALSSQGQRLLRGRPIPSVRRIRGWIDACARLSTPMPDHTSQTAPAAA